MKLRNTLGVSLTCLSMASGVACTGDTIGNDRSAWTTDATAKDSGPSDSRGDASSAAAFACSTACFGVCSESQVLAIADALDEAEIAQARAVVDRTSNSAVQAYAQKMIDDHRHLDSASTGIVATENLMSKLLIDEANRTVTLLGTENGTQLDRDYTNRQIYAHLMALGTIEHLLIPSSKTPELMAALQDDRKVALSHLTLAIGLQSTLGIACGGSPSDCVDSTK